MGAPQQQQQQQPYMAAQPVYYQQQPYHSGPTATPSPPQPGYLPHGYPPISSPPVAASPPVNNPLSVPAKEEERRRPSSATPKLTDEQLISSWFKQADLNHSGSIDARELSVAFQASNLPPMGPSTVLALFNQFDIQRSYRMDLTTFQALVHYVRDWHKMFLNFDKDRSGVIDKTEFKQAIQTFGYLLSDKILTTIMKRYDGVGDETMVFDDFVHACSSVRALTERFKQLDKQRANSVTMTYEQFLELVFSSI